MQYRRLFLLLGMLALLFAATALDPVHDRINQFLEWAKQVIRQHEALGLMLFVILSALSAVFFFLSTAVIIPVAVYAWGKPMTIFLLWGSWILGATLSYWIGRHPGRKLTKWIVKPRKVAQYEKKITARANFPLVLLFQVAVPSEIPGYVLGTLRYRFGKYLSARAIAEVPFAFAAVYLGDAFVKRQYLPLILVSAASLIFSGTAIYLLHKRIGGKG